MNQVRKAVIPAAGYGTRMLPITKTVSKEMLPIVDKPIIQIVVEELVEAGITDIIIITAAHKADISDYFGEVEKGLASHLQAAGPSKAEVLQQLEQVRGLASFAFIEQHGVYGTGTPVLNAAPYLGGEPFVYTFADDFFVPLAGKGENSFRQMMNAYDLYDAPILACQRRTTEADYKRYGFVGGDELSEGVVDVHAIIEQPGKENAPGDLASIGGFIVTPEVIGYLDQVRAQLPAGKELFFHAAFGMMVADGKRVIAKEIVDADYYDTGNKLEYMKTAVAMAARHPEIGPEFTQYLQEFLEHNKRETS